MLIGAANLTVRGLGETFPCPVVFAPAGSLYLLGATTLETFGVEVDPATMKLKPILGIIGGFLASRGSPVPGQHGQGTNAPDRT